MAAPTRVLLQGGSPRQQNDEGKLQLTGPGETRHRGQNLREPWGPWECGLTHLLLTDDALP